VSVLEEALRNLGEPQHYRSTDMVKTVGKRHAAAKKLHEDRAFGLLSLHAFTIEHYRQYLGTPEDQQRTRRKGIAHGLQVPPNERIEVIRMLHVIQTVTEI
jgi:hypothetical protein